MAMLKFQFHIIGRADHISNLETIDLRVHAQFNFALQMAVSWSKNILNEQNCPDQILLGAMDTDFCLLLALGCYLETHLGEQGPQGKRFLFGNTDTDDEPIRVNERYQRVLRRTFKHDEMKALIAQFRGDLGSHSDRKFPATWAAEHGASQAKSTKLMATTRVLPTSSTRCTKTRGLLVERMPLAKAGNTPI
jgi:hypothetical protein